MRPVKTEKMAPPEERGLGGPIKSDLVTQKSPREYEGYERHTKEHKNVREMAPEDPDSKKYKKIIKMGPRGTKCTFSRKPLQNPSEKHILINFPTEHEEFSHFKETVILVRVL